MILRGFQLVRSHSLLLTLSAASDIAQRLAEIHYGYYRTGTVKPEGLLLVQSAAVTKALFILSIIIFACRKWRREAPQSPRLQAVVPHTASGIMTAVLMAALLLTLHAGLQFDAVGLPLYYVVPMMLIADPAVTPMFAAMLTLVCCALLNRFRWQ